jgi:hypothetical protein
MFGAEMIKPVLVMSGLFLLICVLATVWWLRLKPKQSMLWLNSDRYMLSVRIGITSSNDSIDMLDAYPNLDQHSPDWVYSVQSDTEAFSVGFDREGGDYSQYVDAMIEFDNMKVYETAQGVSIAVHQSWSDGSFYIHTPVHKFGITDEGAKDEPDVFLIISGSPLRNDEGLSKLIQNLDVIRIAGDPSDPHNTHNPEGG